jgi:hypothetical protein
MLTAQPAGCTPPARLPPQPTPTVGRGHEDGADGDAGVVGVEEALRRERHERRNGGAERVARHRDVLELGAGEHLGLEGGPDVGPDHVEHRGEAGWWGGTGRSGVRRGEAQ